MQRPCDFRFAQNLAQVANRHDIETVGRLIQHEVRRIVDERARHRDLDALSLREPLGAAIHEAFHAERAAQLRGARLHELFGQAVQRAEILDVLAGREIAVEPGCMRQNAETAARGGSLAADVDAVDARAPAVGREHAIQHAQGGRLAGAVRPEEPGDFAVGRAKRHVADRFDRTESFAERGRLDHGAGPVEADEERRGTMLFETRRIERLADRAHRERRPRAAACSPLPAARGPRRAAPAADVARARARAARHSRAASPDRPRPTGARSARRCATGRADPHPPDPSARACRSPRAHRAARCPDRSHRVAADRWRRRTAHPRCRRRCSACRSRVAPGSRGPSSRSAPRAARGGPRRPGGSVWAGVMPGWRCTTASAMPSPRRCD